jgi:hypothetical protein
MLLRECVGAALVATDDRHKLRFLQLLHMRRCGAISDVADPDDAPSNGHSIPPPK